MHVDRQRAAGGDALGLGVRVGAACHRCNELDALGQLGCRELRHELLPPDTHRPGFEPAARLARRDHDSFERRLGAHPCDERLARRLRRDVLILDVDEPLGARDRGDRRALDLADVLVALLERRERAHDADGQVFEVRLDVARPAAVPRGSRLDRFAAGVLPASPRPLAERCGGVALDDHLHVVHRRIVLVVRIAAARFRGMVGRDVPAAHGQVDAAAIGDGVVDDHELLVMRRAERQMAVEQNLDSLRLAMPEDEARKELAVHRVEDWVVPQQNLDRQLWPALQQPLEQLADLDGCAVGGPRAAFEPRAAVQLPAQNEDRVLRGEQRSAERCEVVRGVDENGRARGVRAPPAGIALD